MTFPPHIVPSLHLNMDIPAIISILSIPLTLTLSYFYLIHSHLSHPTFTTLPLHALTHFPHTPLPHSSLHLISDPCPGHTHPKYLHTSKLSTSGTIFLKLSQSPLLTFSTFRSSEPVTSYFVAQSLLDWLSLNGFLGIGTILSYCRLLITVDGNFTVSHCEAKSVQSESLKDIGHALTAIDLFYW